MIPLGLEASRLSINIDEQETIITTFSDGAYGEGGYQGFC